MAQTLEIIEIVILFAAIAFMATCIWQWKSKDSLSCKAVQMGLAAILFALEISRLIMQVSLDKSYGMTIFLLCMWGLNVVLNAFLIGNKMGEQSASLDVVIKVINDVIERSEESNKEEDDNN